MNHTFWNQPNKNYRNFQIAFTLLTLNFAIPTITYIFAPDMAMAQFVELNGLLGGVHYTVDEASSHFWRYLGAANVGTLAFMCLLLQVNLRRFRPILVPLAFMKLMAATLWLAGFFASPQYPAFGAAALLDFGTTAAFLFFATRAWREIRNTTNHQLVPAPRFAE